MQVITLWTQHLQTCNLQLKPRCYSDHLHSLSGKVTWATSWALQYCKRVGRLEDDPIKLGAAVLVFIRLGPPFCFWSTSLKVKCWCFWVFVTNAPVSWSWWWWNRRACYDMMCNLAKRFRKKEALPNWAYTIAFKCGLWLAHVQCVHIYMYWHRCSARAAPFSCRSASGQSRRKTIVKWSIGR